MMNSKHKNTLIGIAIVVLLVGAYFVFDRSKDEITPVVTTASTTSNTQVNLGNGVVATIPGGYTVETVDQVLQPLPSLTRKVVFGVTLDDRIKALIETKVPEYQALLKNDPKKFDYWIDLGTYFKTAGDYTGAKLYWEYASKLAPTDYISLGNLGNMYAYQLKDMVNAEKYYLQAIKNAPTQSYLYIQLAEGYRDVSKDMTKAKAIIEKGLQAKPNDPALVEFKAILK